MVSMLEEISYFVLQSLRQPLTFGNQDEIKSKMQIILLLFLPMPHVLSET